jgi:hypothetical protein
VHTDHRQVGAIVAPPTQNVRRTTGKLLLTIAGWGLAAGLLTVLLAAIATWRLHQREIDPVSDREKVARSLDIIRASTPAHRKVLKVLFYGQSFTGSGWDKAVVEHWHERYPNTIFVVENRALGGFSSPALLRTAEQDIAAFYPDLIIFHVYGNHHAYEQIIRLVRSKTAADIIVQTDHSAELPDPPCREGLRMMLRQQPGCSGLIWLKQRSWYDEMSYHIIPSLAKEYSLAVEPQRTWWRDYLLETHSNPKEFFSDGIHLNKRGKELIAQFFNRYFDKLVESGSTPRQRNISSIAANDADPSGKEILHFDGSRLELISSTQLVALSGVVVDGESPNDLDGCYRVTRASSIETVPEWPTIRRIELRHDHVVEDWTVTLTQISPDQQTFAFTVKASKTGNEGSGDSSHDFMSKSGRLNIAAEDWMLQRAYDVKHIPLHAPLEANWSVVSDCVGVPEVIDLGDGEAQYRYVLATGLANKQHTITLSFTPNELANVVEFRAYRPLLR